MEIGSLYGLHRVHGIKDEKYGGIVGAINLHNIFNDDPECVIQFSYQKCNTLIFLDFADKKIMKNQVDQIYRQLVMIVPWVSKNSSL